MSLKFPLKCAHARARARSQLASHQQSQDDYYTLGKMCVYVRVRVYVFRELIDEARFYTRAKNDLRA